jgi:hypothetical protein
MYNVIILHFRDQYTNDLSVIKESSKDIVDRENR